jgi:hypothetical protein
MSGDIIPPIAGEGGEAERTEQAGERRERSQLCDA